MVDMVKQGIKNASLRFGVYDNNKIIITIVVATKELRMVLDSSSNDSNNRI
jgi:hypothetical protein